MGCGAALTVPVRRVALPAHAHQDAWHDFLGVLMEAGTFAVEPHRSGSPWRDWDEAEGQAQGLYAPVFALSLGPAGSVVIAPGDVRGTALIGGRDDGYCLGLTGGVDGPNLGCEQCGRPVATRIDDCSYWQAVWLDPGAVVAREDGADPVDDWADLRGLRPGTPPVEQQGHWDLRWTAAVGVALAHLVAAADGARIVMPAGLTTEVFQRSLDSLLPVQERPFEPGPEWPGPEWPGDRVQERPVGSGRGLPEKRVVMAGPGVPVDPEADILLVPRHPQTGESWPSPGATPVAPLEWDVWVWLAFTRDRRPVPGAGAMPDDALRDDPLPLHPHTPFRPDARAFHATLARLPAVREPWLRAIYDGQRRVRYAYSL
ncbi:hypothetical protein GCM10010435_78160 [Winogradskya consettensis]|uniref:Uncharacterized protein n=1 Tax=Winogradskya consettensis TaxID=113560 RepID=A0A919VTJ6_9ACTN|nr:hypothetical protein Aco04nite_42370 [Actinoplanes consettensis]